MNPYIELRGRSAYSFGDGVLSPDVLVRRAAELGYEAMALTDAAELGGIIRFGMEARDLGVRPIVGSELRVDGRPAALLARDETGYRNLASLVTRARLGRARGVPGVAFADVEERSEGLHLLTGPSSGELAMRIRQKEPERAARALGRWRELFGERMAVEVQLHEVSGAESALAGALIELAERERVPWVVTQEPRYLDREGRLVHDLMTALRAGVDVDTAARRGALLPNGEWALRSPDEVASRWKGREPGLEESVRIASECDFQLRWLRPPLPSFPLPSGATEDSFLRERVFEGAAERWGSLREREREQVEKELRVIAKLGFAGFFLVMWRAVRFARAQGILCQGRGSAANSVVAFCLGITAVDPVKHNLLFERFLSEARTDGLTEAPDIDVDFEMHRREEVLSYMYETYGRERAAITAVTQTYHAPSALQDMMRALGYPPELAFALSKRLHHYSPADGADHLERELGAQHGLDVTTPRARALLTAMRVLDEVPRMRSTHPGGFVLSSEPLGSYIPIEETTMGRTILQFDKDDLDAIGVPKFDFLGLGGLTAIRLAFDAIERRTGQRLELYNLPQDDVPTYEMISRGDTLGTFQVESRAQIQSLLQTKPDQLYDLVVQVALIRPGPIQAKFVHPYTRRRRGLEEVSYRHADLKSILERTQGIPIFQEQAMAIAMALGGFTAAEADELRRSMGHRRKIPRLNSALAKLEERMVERGVDSQTSREIVEDFKTFANYGFPESHAWSFALIAYATAYLKARYPADFLLGLLNAWPMGFYAPATLVHDARRHGVEVRPPCLMRGEADCTVEDAGVGGQRPGVGALDEPRLSSRAERGICGTEDCSGSAGGDRQQRLLLPRAADPSIAALSQDDSAVAALCQADGAFLPIPAIRIGWRHIRGVGARTLERLRDAQREAPFTSIQDVVRRARLTAAEALHLSRAGGFEAFEPGRHRSAWEALRAAGDLLPLAPARRLPFDPQELQGDELIFLDYLATGICVHGHPMEHIRERLWRGGVASSQDLAERQERGSLVVAGLVIARQHPETAQGTVFVLLEDEWGFINVIVPAEIYKKNRETVKFSRFLVVEGRFEREDQVINIVGRRFRELPTPAMPRVSHDFH